MNAYRIEEFIRTLKEDGDFYRPHVRLPKDAPVIKKRDAFQIRTTKHTADAFACDILGNTTVLWSNGRIQQLIGDEAKHLYR